MRGFLVLITLAPIVAIPSSSLFDPKSEIREASVVDVKIYVESLCPFCKDFISQLTTQAPLLAPIMELQIFPYGNAHPLSGTDNCSACTSCNAWECNVTCQHGTHECKLNLAQACLLNFVPALEALPAVKCIDHVTLAPGWCISHRAPDGPKLAAEVSECLRSPLGREIQERMATATLQLLNPPKQFVPWVTVDGVPLLDNYKNIVPAVCQAFKDRGGSIPPTICNQYPVADRQWGTPPAAFDEFGQYGNQTVIYVRCKVLKVLGTVCVSVVANSTDSTALSLGAVLEFKRPGTLPLL
jgi:interferon, gamma-inducible protein 30